MGRNVSAAVHIYALKLVKDLLHLAESHVELECVLPQHGRLGSLLHNGLRLLLCDEGRLRLRERALRCDALRGQAALLPVGHEDPKGQADTDALRRPVVVEDQEPPPTRIGGSSPAGEQFADAELLGRIDAQFAKDPRQVTGGHDGRQRVALGTQLLASRCQIIKCHFAIPMDINERMGCGNASAIDCKTLGEFFQATAVVAFALEHQRPVVRLGHLKPPDILPRATRRPLATLHSAPPRGCGHIG
mmetsp:Transcript_71913/g.201830  ORF Transcript_71913/g.201830 Transcript_71913/m.201830 type:complete len:246 (-) Transcript_71913:88-825(-)